MNDITVCIPPNELPAFLCARDATVREALARMNLTPDVFQLVADEHGKLLGTISDGDIRRALLAGAALDDAVTKFMNSNPVTGSEQALASAHGRVNNILNQHRFLPLIDDNRKIVAILVRRQISYTPPTALVMAGGRGQRLREKTMDTPKPLLHVRGKPMLEHVLACIETAGIQRAFVSTHYLAEQIETYCTKRSGSCQLEILRETAPTGTAGALSLVPDDVTGPLLVMNGDVVSNVDLIAMYDLHIERGWDATVAVARHEFEVPFGVVKTDESANLIGIEEKPRIRNFVAAGIYLLNAEIRNLVAKGKCIDMPELIDAGRKAGLKLGVFPIHENWRDVGRPEDLEAANAEAIVLL